MTVFRVRPDPVPATTAGLTTAEITSILARLDPAALQDAGAAHTGLGRELATMAAHLAQEAGTLAQNWSGTAARTALAQFQRLHEQTATLAAQASQTGAVLTWLGTQSLPAFQHPADSAQAREYLTQLTADLTRADASLPAEVGTPTGRPSQVSPVSSLQSAGPIPNASAAGTAASPAPSPVVTPASAFAPVPGPVTLVNVPRMTAHPQTTDAAPDLPEAAPVTPPATDADVSAPLIARVSAGTSSRTGCSRDPGDHHEPQQSSATNLSTAHTAAASTLPGAPAPVPELSTGGPALSARPLPALATLDSGLPGITNPPDQDRDSQSWATGDRNLWGLPVGCVPPLIKGG